MAAITGTDKMNPTLRETYEQREANFIAPYGCLSRNTRGRKADEPSCPIRTAFQVDRDRILYSNAFRRLKHKTQVFLSPLGDEYRTRLTHTLEVAQIARTIARAMHLNEDLTEAIALGHDLGHTPFGHGGETALREIYSRGFTHQRQSLRVVDEIENNGRGLNLTCEVRDGILKHSKGYGKIIPDDPAKLACTLEGQVVRIADIMAYLNHDLDDALRSGVISIGQLPEQCLRVLGATHSQRATTMIRDLVYTSRVEGERLILDMSPEVFGAMTSLRAFLFDNVYRSPRVHEEFVKAKKILSELYQYFMENEQQLKNQLIKMEMSGCLGNGNPQDRTVCDFIASMTDRYALELYAKTFFPRPTV